MSVRQPVILYGPDGQTLISTTNPLPMGLSQNGAAVNVNNPVPTVPGAIVANLNGNGTAAAPGAGSAFVSIANVPTGWYRMEALYTVTGAVETAAKNIRLSMATGGSITDFPSGAGVGAVYSFVVDAVLVSTNNDTVRLTAIAAATASTVYTGTLTLYRLA